VEVVPVMVVVVVAGLLVADVVAVTLEVVLEEALDMGVEVAVVEVEAGLDKHERVFDPNDGCVFEDCSHFRDCVATYNGIRNFVPTIAIVEGNEAAHVGGVGGGHKVGLVKCMSYSPKNKVGGETGALSA